MTTGTQIDNPTVQLISTLSRVFRNVPNGSVVVAAADVLLSLPDDTVIESFTNSESESDHSQTTVLGVGVPSPLATACNHGVFVVPANANLGHSKQIMAIQDVHTFLQKPSVEDMEQTCDPCCVFDASGERSAWVDTGVVAFFPAAAQTLRDLANGILGCCTKRGLDALYFNLYHTDHNHNNNADTDTNVSEMSSPPPSMEQFASEYGIRLELYSHLMLALSTAGATTSSCQSSPRDLYIAKHKGDMDPSILGQVFDVIHQYQLRVCVVPSAQFIHLGTTQELLEFLIYGSRRHLQDDGNNDASISSTMMDKNQMRCTQFGRKIGLVRRSHTFLSGDIATNGHTVILNSQLRVMGKAENTPPNSIGTGTVIEHVDVTVYKGLTIGTNCLISGLRGLFQGRVVIPDGMCIHMIPLKETASTNTQRIDSKQRQRYALICLAVKDPIKACSTLYSLPFHQVLEKSGMHVDDVWEKSIPPNKRQLWNAKIHPIVELPKKDEHVVLDFLEWINYLCNSNLVSTTKAVAKDLEWLSKCALIPKLSLSQIGAMADATTEHSYRHTLMTERIPLSIETHKQEMEHLILNRLHLPCDFSNVVDAYMNGNEEVLRSSLKILDGIVMKTTKNGLFDIAGRCFMLMSSLFVDIANSLSAGHDANNIDLHFTTEFNSAIEVIRSTIDYDNVEKERACSTFLVMRDNALFSDDESLASARQLLQSAEYMELVAHAMTELCVSGGVDPVVERCEGFSTNNNGEWVLSTAPARIDLSGGWSDTPPISFEHGGAVSSLAVTVDDRKPFSCRCRFVKGAPMVTMKTESRDPNDGTLLYSTESQCFTTADFSDYRNPNADCALIKCALLCLGLMPLNEVNAEDPREFKPYLHEFCNRKGTVGLEIISTSLLPRGSGMGGSSILAACIVSAIANCVGIKLFDNEDGENKQQLVIQAVLRVEQLLTTGGGWQDQIGGIFGGLKLGTSDAHVIPLRTRVKEFHLPPEIEIELNNRLTLVFTGRPRLAKNILQNVLRRWARRSPEIVETVKELVQGAKEMTESAQSGDLDRLGMCLGQYWEQKKKMAGKDSGVEPVVVEQVLSKLRNERKIDGGTLCGAGGGGFLALLARKGRNSGDLQTWIESHKGLFHADVNLFSWHKCAVCNEGLATQTVTSSNSDSFDIRWHNVTS
eukprot:CAMPEP_0198290034 /NCGR_PEP_ID=MMETSP1449-20131203/8028_1 /TAXON_ID=420275 /ORGANISM="Attheya septentrionalis, Strain CCMP2084" /LENGTH=1166 /DNA_ID=CAMNT_0043988459 /DNA_START=189 /DNA_END=3689 /DNA_ORIENTATION=-